MQLLIFSTLVNLAQVIGAAPTFGSNMFAPSRPILYSLQSEIFSNENDIPGLLDQPGVKPLLVGKLFEAAGFFYRAQPWINLVNEDLVAIRVGDQSEPYYCSVMGIAGQEYG